MSSNVATGIPATIHKPALTVPGATPDSKALVESLLEKDREAAHCLYGPGYHNHLSHHLLTAYDLGASSALLQAIYDKENTALSSVFAADVKRNVVERQEVKIQEDNWKEYLGQDKYYANLLIFFSEKVQEIGGHAAFEQYVYSRTADGAFMVERLVAGALHPWIQMGFAIEFGSDAMVAQALAQTAIHTPLNPELFAWNLASESNSPADLLHANSSSLLDVLQETYASPTMKPVMPYDPNALIGQRGKDMLTPARIVEIRRLTALWGCSAAALTPAATAEKARDLIFVATLLFAGTGKRGRAPRLDFFLMHVLTSALFVPHLLDALRSDEAKARLLNSYLVSLLVIVMIRGRPRIDAGLLMSYTATPVPPSQRSPAKASTTSTSAAFGTPTGPGYANTWVGLLPHILPACDAHTLKAFRTLYVAAQRYGQLPRGSLSGEGVQDVDGSVFARVAGVLLDVMGWVGPGEGQDEGTWDRSALGWDAAWDEQDK
ncbi:hypothetical protein BV25DRAFT_1805308 [Artomyces pyxidatus]|uniref:Uncharacterized protein n=1 Tax=Artomyces pyxidatus TaxID=48021 RepID=A0ACB8SZI6_9AGAM|nr:hypothetical protein BV25DRAFT_1805308 [Artomyces pyxidatus]